MQNFYKCSLRISSCTYETTDLKEFAAHYRMNHRADHGMLKTELYITQISKAHPLQPQAMRVEQFTKQIGSPCPNEPGIKSIDPFYKTTQKKQCTCDLSTKRKDVHLLKHIIRTHQIPKGLTSTFFYCINHKDVPLAYERAPLDLHVKKSAEDSFAIKQGAFTYNGTSWEFTPDKQLSHINEVLNDIINHTEISHSLERNSHPIQPQPAPIVPQAALNDEGYRVQQNKQCTCDLAKMHKEEKEGLLGHIFRTHAYPEGVIVKFFYCKNHKDTPLNYQKKTLLSHIKKSNEKDSVIKSGFFRYNGSSWTLTSEATKQSTIPEILEAMANQAKVTQPQKRQAASEEKTAKKARVREDSNEAEANMAVVHDLFPEAILPEIPRPILEVPHPVPISQLENPFWDEL